MRATLAVLLLALLLAAPSFAAAPRSAERPLTAPGDWWATLTSVRSELGQTTEVTTNTSVLRVESVVYQHAQRSAIRSESVSVVKRSIGSGPNAIPNWAWTNTTSWATADGGQLAQLTNVTVTLDGRPQTRTSRLLEWDAPCYEFDWPLAVGTSWTVQCNGYVRSGSSLARYYDNSTYWVNDTGTVRNRAGDFDTLVITNGTAGGRGSTQHYAPHACAVVHIEGRGDSGNVTTRVDLMDYHCASTAPPPASTTAVSTTPTTGVASLVVILVTLAALVGPRARGRAARVPRRARR